jgi:YD repeat-containing protein
MVISRQQYGLGSLVKSIGKGVKKFVKSPLGKGLILGGLGMYGMGMGPFGAGGMFSGAKGAGFLRGMGGALFGGEGIGAAGKHGAKTGFFGKLMGSIPGGGFTVGAIGSILAAKGMSPQEIEATKRDPEKLKIYLRDYYRKTNPDLSDDEIDAFVETNVSEYATGGRVGLQGGGMDAGAESDFQIPSTPPPGHPEFNIGAGGGITTLDTAGGAGRDPNEPNILERITGNPYLNTAASFLLPQTKMKKAWDMINFINTAKKIKDKDLEYGLPYQKGGRVGLNEGTPKQPQSGSFKVYEGKFEDLPLSKGPYKIKYDEDGNPIRIPIPKGEPHRIQYDEEGKIKKIPSRLLGKLKKAKGGRIGYAFGTPDTAQAAGIMGNLPVRQNKAGVNELDLRETGGFIPPVGVKEKADDVPAMLSNNEFVFTADAVRAAGGGSVNKGAQRMYDLMKNLESKVG